MKFALSRQWFFVLIFSAIVIVISNIPYIYGYSVAPSDKIFMGDARSFIDTNTYLAWMHQAKDGHFLFKNIYTTEPHGRMLFHPLFLLLGNVSRFTGLSLITVHSLARIFFGFALLIFSYFFLSLFIEGDFNRALAFILVSISGGFGWLKYFPSVSKIPESWFLTGWVEGNTFFSIYSLPLFSASILMLLATFYLMIKSFETRKLIYSVLAGVVCFFLVSTHYYDALIVYPVLMVFIMLKFLFSKDLKAVLFDSKSFAIMLLISIISPLYNVWASIVNPVFKEWAWKSSITLSPGFIWFLALFGFLACFSILGALSIIGNSSQTKYFYRNLFLVAWVFSVPFLIFLPIPFQRRLIEGVHVPIALLSLYGILFLINKFKMDKKMAAALILFMVLPGSITLLSDDMNYLRQNSAFQSVAGFLDKDIYESFKWLEANTSRDDIVLADYELGNYIPAISGNVVYIGHSPETINFWDKWALVKQFYNNDAGDEYRKAFLSATGTKYILYSWKEKKIGEFNPNSSDYLNKVYGNKSVSIFSPRI